MKEIRTKLHHYCDGTTATIDTGRIHYYSIRIKNLACFSDLYAIQENLLDYGLGLHKSSILDKTVLITVQKSFYLELLPDNIYKNLQEEYKYYFELEKYLNWDKFKELTLLVKNNIRNNLFDAAQAYFYTPDGIADVVRIYDRNGSPERINEIKEQYKRALKRI